MLCPGDILISMTGYIGDTAWVRESDLPAVVNQRVGIFSLAEPHAIERRFLFYVLRSDEVRSEFERRGYGSAQPNISPSLIQTVAIPLPPLAEQRAIAEVLGALDDKIEANRRLVQILLSHVSETWRFHFETERADWPVRPIGEVARVVGGSTPRTTVEAFWDGDIPWATPRDLSHLSSAPLLATERRITELGLQQISSGLLPRGTVLLSSRAPIGYLAIAEVPLAVNQGFIALVPGEHLPGLYLWQWLNHHMDEIVSRANGTTFLEVSKANFRPMLISLPPSELVEGWLLAAESMYAAIVGKEVESNALVQLRDTLLPRLLSGELRLRDAESLVGQAV
jgi:type I restriction enzyme S subunit